MSRTQRHAWLGLGGNIGDVQQAMAEALRWLHGNAEITVETVSAIYKTPPWGFEDQPWFLNCCARITTSLSPEDLLSACQEAERLGKRERTVRWGPRTIDIDIIAYQGGGTERAAFDDSPSQSNGARFCSGAVGGHRARTDATGSDRAGRPYGHRHFRNRSGKSHNRLVALVNSQAGAVDIALAVQAQADKGHQLAIHPHRDGDVHGVFAFEIGNHGAAQLFALDTEHQLLSSQAARYNIQPFAFGTVQKFAPIGTAAFGNSRLNGLGKTVQPDRIPPVSYRRAQAIDPQDCR